MSDGWISKDDFRDPFSFFPKIPTGVGPLFVFVVSSKNFEVFHKNFRLEFLQISPEINSGNLLGIDVKEFSYGHTNKSDYPIYIVKK